MVSEAIPPPEKPRLRLSYSPAVHYLLSLDLNQREKRYAVLLQLSDVYYVSVVASRLHVFPFVVFEII